MDPASSKHKLLADRTISTWKVLFVELLFSDRYYEKPLDLTSILKNLFSSETPDLPSHSIYLADILLWWRYSCSTRKSRSSLLISTYPSCVFHPFPEVMRGHKHCLFWSAPTLNFVLLWRIEEPNKLLLILLICFVTLMELQTFPFF